MAARLLRLSSFKGLQADRWGLLRSPSAASFCTKTEDPTKPGKKKKAAVKTEAPDLRESLLAYKSTVGFPVRPAVLLTNMVGGAETASTSSSFPAVAASEVESDSSHPAQVVADRASSPAEEEGGEQVDAAAVPTAATEGAPTPESGDAAAGETSSSSDSESDSDSDSEDEKSTSAGPAASAEPQRSSGEEEEHPLEVTGEQAGVQGGRDGTAPREGSGGSEKPEPPKPSIPQTPAEEAEKVDEEVLEDDAPAVSEAPPPSPVQAADICEAPPPPPVQAADISEAPPPPPVQAADISEAPPPPPVQAADISEAPPPPPVHAATINEALPPPPVHAATISEAPPPVQAAVPDEVQSSGPAEHPVEEPAAEPSAECLDGAEVIEPQDLSAKPPEDQSEASSPAGVPEELVDPGQVLDAAGELQLEEASAPEPEPEEPFDNTTYKNYQHHSYNPYTFADLDLEMAKYRLPQPSSGRPSPQH
ncbi:skin secretory protein xP2 isoform X2 [Oryzias melastigma]|uniref:skin secretory protein xP2 isoform X2 n=1 Tax=Oryzias melastigma TaxID=30732 RepID=UPI00168CB1E5|nr:skin secretory protein xP2 isoform X2 [Oryzias melastigma]